MNFRALYEMTAGKRSLGFDDVHILSSRPQMVDSRSDVDFERDRLIVAPMSALQDEEFVEAACDARISIAIHRFCTPEEQRDLIAIAKRARGAIWVAVGLNDWEERLRVIDKVTTAYSVLIDVANGFSYEVQSLVKKLIEDGRVVMAGNIHTVQGAVHLKEAQYLRVGIANGAACATRDKTGVTRGQISSVMAAAYACDDNLIVSDGGIRSPADVAKAFGAGATEVMMGGIFAKAKEAKCYKTDGIYYGGASARQKELIGADIRYVEGKEVLITNASLRQSEDGLSLEEIVQQIQDGVRSAVSYSGYSHLYDFIGNADFELV